MPIPEPPGGITSVGTDSTAGKRGTVTTGSGKGSPGGPGGTTSIGKDTRAGGQPPNDGPGFGPGAMGGATNPGRPSNPSTPSGAPSQRRSG